MDFNITYRRLIDKIISNGIQIREDSRLSYDNRYIFQRCGQLLCVAIHKHCPQIRVYRSDEPAAPWIDNNSKCCRIDEFIRRSWGVHELIGVAHEFGHSQSPDVDIDPIYICIQKNNFFCNDEDRRRILKEEQFAWSRAFEILSEIGFQDWNTFIAQEISALTSYLAIATKENV